MKYKIITAILMLLMLAGLIREISQINFRSEYKTDVYKKVYEQSQYRNGQGLIGDHIVYLYAAGSLMEGGNPLKINPEVPPLGEYMIGLSILLFNNPNYTVVAASILILFALFLLGNKLYKKPALALIPVSLFGLERLFLDQLKLPLLDIIQLPFILLAFYFFFCSVTTNQKRYYLATGLVLGFVIGIKVMITGVLMVIAWMVYLFIARNWRSIRDLVFLTLPTAFAVLVVSYLRIFIYGVSFWYFLLVQKWVLLYQQGKIQYPFSAWKLLLFNQWQAWWGDYSILHTVDWRITWPIITLMSFFFILYKLVKKETWSEMEGIITAWVVVFSGFISLGTISTRHLLPFLPFLYLLSFKFIYRFIDKHK
ncbi:hypothetical protein COW99_02650 [Candidatus Roizmanbacteria bacterium CG22_combo_CG10-13_8_21_14_all_38_20]|uniref:Glycosyltransferase RgtA/B/C/D-like domain-containing protein n=1 Tax=Candidatus Roizmanbacteria bacterium CG22_combo_CG10-13_8_21_14_all_38_20 TaxID=1974862 RepID=A0A2H0BVQ2_9BACT|nr:glycosyltransferase family 39 protein [Candidatus Microgenomates bacterium]PIP61755.1 MAG: hypothetical protein COW99_02650 [Candidatus Roizmanbacteria bacterium CG22_combo_CG10-13_8_21_14_all_38_20]PJC32063.1 MAG: hypothetical protein CO050_01035 [Candidatus Roizmanbacteria bacterium CG_4_9_14_0_2_um_filter_38_17]